MTRTIFDLIQSHPAATHLLFQEHGTMQTGHLLKMYGTLREAQAASLGGGSGGLFLLDEAGRELSRRQGKKLAREGVVLSQIITGSGYWRRDTTEETAVLIAEGYATISGEWPAFSDQGVDCPDYRAKVIRPHVRELGPELFMVRWLNDTEWKNDWQYTVHPSMFADNVHENIQRVVKNGPGVTMVCTYAEEMILAHNHYVEHLARGSFREDWFPEPSSGVLLVCCADGIEGYDYRPDFTIVEQAEDVLKGNEP